MQLIIGLGNPGEEYVATRHNVGYMVIDKISKMPRIKNSKQIIIFKSQSFMNDSGTSVKEILDRTKVSTSNLYVIHDDLDLPLGIWKIQFAKGPKDNGGINSIEQVLGTKNFWRVRVGIDPTTPRLRGVGNGSDFVLGEFTEEEKEILDKTIKEICKKLVTL